LVCTVSLFIIISWNCCFCPINLFGILKIPSARMSDSFGEWCELDTSWMDVVVCQMKKKICFWLYIRRSNRVLCAFNNSFWNPISCLLLGPSNDWNPYLFSFFGFIQISISSLSLLCCFQLPNSDSKKMAAIENPNSVLRTKFAKAVKLSFVPLVLNGTIIAVYLGLSRLKWCRKNTNSKMYENTPSLFF